MHPLMVRFHAYLTARHRPTTVAGQLDVGIRYLRWLGSREVSTETAQAFLDSLAKTHRPSTRATYRIALRSLLAMLRLPRDLYGPSVQIERPRYLEDDEVARLFKAAASDPFTLALMTVLLDTAARIGEIVGRPDAALPGLLVRDLDLVNGFAKVVGKGGRERDIIFTPPGLAALKEWLRVRPQQDHPLVFGGISYQQSWKKLKEASNAAGVIFKPHWLRHTRAKQDRLAGLRDADVMNHLGHKNVQTTMNIYGPLKPHDLQTRLPTFAPGEATPE